MKHEFIVCLSKAWRKIRSRQSRYSSALLGQEVCAHIRSIIDAHPNLFPPPTSLECRHIDALYTPPFDSPPWAWWNQVVVTYVCDESHSKATSLIIEDLKKLLPEGTHICE